MPEYGDFATDKLLATVAWKEGRGEISKFGETSILAIMHVIVNRSDAWDQSVEHVILGPNQFTSMSVPTDSQYNLLPPEADPAYQVILADAHDVLAGLSVDPTDGALYYANLDHIQPGGWFERHIVNDPNRHPVTVRIGHHTFFK